MSRKLDALVHERVFGRPVKWAEKGKLLKADYDPDIDGIDLHVAIFYRAAMEVPDYFSDVAAAWRVMDKMFEIDDQEIYLAFRHFIHAMGGVSPSHVMPERICLAALRAVGVPEAEIQEAQDADDTV